MGQTQNNPSIQIKDLIDTIYELVKGPAGYTGALTRLSSQASIVVPILKQRGILICTTPPKNKFPHYIWSEKAMAPNNTLYRNIINDYLGIKYAKNVKEREKRSLARKAASCNSQPVQQNLQPVQQNLQPVHAPEPKPEKPIVEITPINNTLTNLALYTEQELWDELKARGAVVIDGQIKVIKEYVLS